MTSALIGSSAMQGCADISDGSVELYVVVTTAITDVDPRRTKTHRGRCWYHVDPFIVMGVSPSSRKGVGRTQVAMDADTLVAVPRRLVQPNQRMRSTVYTCVEILSDLTKHSLIESWCRYRPSKGLHSTVFKRPIQAALAIDDIYSSSASRWVLACPAGVRSIMGLVQHIYDDQAGTSRLIHCGLSPARFRFVSQSRSWMAFRLHGGAPAWCDPGPAMVCRSGSSPHR